jgi:hypothetical protein
MTGEKLIGEDLEGSGRGPNGSIILQFAPESLRKSMNKLSYNSG